MHFELPCIAFEAERSFSPFRRITYHLRSIMTEHRLKSCFFYSILNPPQRTYVERLMDVWIDWPQFA